MTAASPGVIAIFAANDYYPSEDEYLEALANAMRTEYEAITRLGSPCNSTVQIWRYARTGTSLAGVPRGDRTAGGGAQLRMANIPAEAMRVHMCWGNGEVPRTMTSLSRTSSKPC